MIQLAEFNPWSALAGGLLLGTGAALLLLARGRIAGISGMLAGLLNRATPGWGCGLQFLGGLVAGAALMLLAGGGQPLALTTAPWQLALAGLAVGIGARWANGCTSGHGICGIGRLSPRSLVATGVFMTTGFITVFVVRHLLGGGV